MKFFRTIQKSRVSNARIGKITTRHGVIKTPAFVPVATKGTLKALPPKELETIGVQTAFVNTFHLVAHPGSEVIKSFGGIHQYAGLSIPLMSDSAGFQVFSLGSGKALKGARTHDLEEAPLERITEEGVWFRSPREGKRLLFTPEVSIKHQENIGADLIMAFDECVYYGASYEYTQKATERTHRWFERCVKAHRKTDQYLYGIIQGGVFKDLRIDSAKFVREQKVAGVAIGGVSVGESKQEMREQVAWAAPYLPKEKPVHLLGIGRVEDIVELVGQGIDTFDCVEPSRLARNGVVYKWKGRSEDPKKREVERLDLAKSKYAKTKAPIQKNCACYTCDNFSLSFLHHLFKEQELLGYYLATWHNLYFFEQFFVDIRARIEQGLL